MENRIYLPDIVGGGYRDFWLDTKRYRILKGGKGSKKSTTTALNFIYRLMKHPAANLLVVRGVMATHRDSTFAQLKWAQERLGVSHLWSNTVSPMEMTYLPTGQKILFRGFDDVLKLASTTVSCGYLCWVWIEEAFEIGSEADFDKLDMSVPRGQTPPHLFKQTTLTFNPWSEQHWLKRRFFDATPDNASCYTTNYLCNEFLSDSDREVFEQMRRRNPRQYEVAGLGNWGVADGLIFDNWEVLDFHLNEKGVPVKQGDEPSVEKEKDWQYRHFFGLDFGYVNDPTAFVAFVVNAERKEIYIYDEFYERRLLNSDIATRIIRMGYGKERIRADCSEPKSIEDLRRLGVARVQPSVKGRDSVINGIMHLQEYKIYVHPKCKNMIYELGCYRWRKDCRENGVNTPEDSDNHLCDALRYAMHDVRYFKPQSPKQNNRLTADGRYFTGKGVYLSDIKGGWGG